MKWHWWLMIGAVLSFAAGCGDGTSPAEPDVPLPLIQSLVAGTVPSTMVRDAATCSAERSGDDVYTARCGAYVFIVTTQAARVVAGDQKTQQRWNAIANPKQPTPLSKADQAEIACESAGGTWGLGTCLLPKTATAIPTATPLSKADLEEIACKGSGGTWALGRCTPPTPVRR